MGFVTKTDSHQPRPMTKKKLHAFIILGITLGITDVVLIVTDPVMIITKHFIRVDYGTFVHEALTEEFDSVHVSAYLFNITNADRFQTGADHKLKVEEVGPFTYQEIRKNENVEIDFKTNSIRYSPKIRTKFLADESVARPRDLNITMPNLAMLSIASKVSTFSFLPRMGFNLLASRLKSKAIVHMTAEDYLWGYEEPIIKLGNTIMPGLVNFDVLGILDRLYDRKANFAIELSSEDKDKFSIKSVNGSRGLDAWSYNDPSKRSKCNTFVNAYEGIGYPPQMDGSEKLRLYRPVFCRILELQYRGKVMTPYSIQGLQYSISENSYTVNDDTKCLCSDGICQDGLSDLSPCFIGLPVVLSNAHYLHADPKLYERIEGIKPDTKLHGSSFVIEPKIGLVMDTRFSIQVSLLIRDVRFNAETSRFSDMVIPIVYFKIIQPPLVPKQQYNLNLIYFVGPKIVLGAQILLGVTSLVLLVYAARSLYWYKLLEASNIDSMLHDMLHSDRRRLDSKVPLMYW